VLVAAPALIARGLPHAPAVGATKGVRGHARALTDAQRDLLLDIRRHHPRASASLIVRTLEADGRLAPKQVSAATVRRLLRAHGLDRQSMKSADADVRRRWQAAHPHALWHADVCHGPR